MRKLHAEGAVLDGVLERVTFANPETGYTIARIAPERGGAELITAVGPLLGAQIGEFLRLRGRWSAHPRYGRQFEVHSYATVLPATAAGIQKYLGSGLIKGIGPVMAERRWRISAWTSCTSSRTSPVGWSRSRGWVPSAPR